MYVCNHVCVRMCMSHRMSLLDFHMDHFCRTEVGRRTVVGRRSSSQRPTKTWPMPSLQSQRKGRERRMRGEGTRSCSPSGSRARCAKIRSRTSGRAAPAARQRTALLYPLLSLPSIQQSPPHMQMWSSAKLRRGLSLGCRRFRSLALRKRSQGRLRRRLDSA